MWITDAAHSILVPVSAALSKTLNRKGGLAYAAEPASLNAGRAQSPQNRDISILPLRFTPGGKSG